MDGRPLGKGGLQIADGRAGAVDPAVDPGLIDHVVLVVVALEIVDQEELLRREAPERARPRADGFGLVDLVDLPIVSCAQVQTARVVLAASHGASQGQGLGVGAEIDFVRSRLTTGPPVERRSDIDVGSAVARLGLAGLNRRLEDADFAETELAHGAIATVGRQAHVLGCDTLHVHGGVGCVGRFGRPLSEDHVFQDRPIGAVLGVFDRDILEPEAEHQLEHDVIVPDHQLVQLVDRVELILDISEFTDRGSARPHICRRHRVLVVCV